MTITPEIRQAVDQAGDGPLRLEDPETHSEYVLLKAEVYDRMHAVIEAERVDPSFFEYGDFTPVERDPD